MTINVSVSLKTVRFMKCEECMMETTRSQSFEHLIMIIIKSNTEEASNR